VSLAAEQRFERIVAGGSLSGAFFFHGDAGKLRDEAARKLADAALEPATRDFNFDTYRGADVAPESLAAALAMAPMMAPRRVVLLQQAERLTPKGCKVVEDVLEKLPSDLTLIVTATIPERSKKAFYKRLKDGALSIEWSAPREAEVPGWLIERAERRYGVGLAADAAAALGAAVGTDPGLLDAELAKLAGVASDGEVDLEKVRELVPNVRDVNRWAWFDVVGGRDYIEALGQLPGLLASPSESAVGLLNGLVEQHLFLGIAVEGGAGRVGEVLAQVGKPYLKWKARAWAGQARSWTPGEIDRALELLLEADRQAKTGHADLAVLEGLLLRLEELKRNVG
jgi:DNA polymerase-3 subunit delta